MGGHIGGVSWTFSRTFRFESEGRLDDVIHALEKEDGGLLDDGDDRMRIERQRDGYTFRYETRYRSQGRFETTAFADGRVWQDQDGDVIVEGTVQVDPTLYLSVGIFALLALVSGAATAGFWGFSLAIGAVAVFMMYVYYEDRNRVLECIAEAVDSAVTPSDRRSQNAPASSVWAEAISENRDR